MSIFTPTSVIHTLVRRPKRNSLGSVESPCHRSVQNLDPHHMSVQNIDPPYRSVQNKLVDPPHKSIRNIDPHHRSIDPPHRLVQNILEDKPHRSMQNLDPSTGPYKSKMKKNPIYIKGNPKNIFNTA